MAKIFAFLDAQALGDFTIAALLASSVRELFDEGELFIYYRNNRPYKKSIVACICNMNGCMISADTPRSVLPSITSISLGDAFHRGMIFLKITG